MQTQIAPKSEKQKKALDIESMRAKDREPVKGIFRFHEVPGGTLKFPYRAYKGDEPEKFTLVDGEVYTIPLGVARHLNKNGWYPVHSHAQDDSGRSIFKVGQKVRRFSFQSLEFVDTEDLSPVGGQLLTVEKVA